MKALVIFALGTLTVPAHSQEQGNPATNTPAADPQVMAKVAALLRKTVALTSYRFRTEVYNPPVKMQTTGAGKQVAIKLPTLKKDTVEAVRDGRLTWWTKTANRVKSQLVSHGARWAFREGGEWIPCRQPMGAWHGKYLPDPGFLAERLLDLLPASAWEYRGPDSIDERPVRVYRCLLSKAASARLQRNGALTSEGAGAIANLQGRWAMKVIRVGARGIFAGAPKSLGGQFEILIYEDPTTKLPAKFVARLFSDSANQTVFVGAGRGIWNAEGKKDDQDEEEAKKKPRLIIETRLTEPGKASAAELDPVARSLVGAKR